MGPSAKRIAILITELMVFFIVTAFTTYFISHAGALRMAPTDIPPAYFPVIAYDGNRERPEAKNYLVVPWSEWGGLAAKRPGASLLLPERSGNISLDGNGKASFSVAPEGASRQSVELNWANNNSEQHVRYAAQAHTIEPHYFRTVTSNTFLIGAAVGFVTGLITGRAMRRRWLAQPGFYAPPAPK